MKNLYYTAPSLRIFNEVKKKAIKIWETYDDTYGYASEKINRIKDLPNVSDNVMMIVAMFDTQNQARLADQLTKSACKAIADRIRAGGLPDNYNMFYE